MNFVFLLDQLKKQEENQLIKSFIGQKKVILAGSTDFKDYNLFKNSMNSDQNKWIIIPHTNSKKDINQVVKLINRKWSLYSNPNDLKNSKIIIVDKHGILKYIYKYANIVYIGGGFTKVFIIV